MTRIFLVRHAQSEWNAQGRWQGQADPPLSDSGRQDAELAAVKLAGFSGRVCSSPLLRAKQTAQIIATQIGRPTVTVETDMREIDVGDFSGLTSDEIAERLPDAWKALQEGALDVFPSGESREHFRVRVLRALEALATRHPGEELLCVTHGGAIATLERHLGVHPGVGVGNLVGRWFEVSDAAVTVSGDRVELLED